MQINLTVKRYGRFASDAKVKWEAVKMLDAQEVPPPVAPPAPSAPAPRRLVAMDGGRRGQDAVR